MLLINQSEATLLGQKNNLKQYIKNLENNLQRTLKNLHIVQDQIDKIYWKNNLISKFNTTDYTINTTSMPLVPETLIL